MNESIARRTENPSPECCPRAALAAREPGFQNQRCIGEERGVGGLRSSTNDFTSVVRERCATAGSGDPLARNAEAALGPRAEIGFQPARVRVQ